MSYADLEILIQRWPTGGYAVDMRFRTADGRSDSELALNVPIALNVVELRGQAEAIDSYGRALSAMIFADQRLRGAWQRAHGFVEGANIPLRIRLRLDPHAPELHAICWEAIFDPDRDVPIGRSERLLLSRYLDSADLGQIRELERSDMLALVAVASPRDLASEYGMQPFDALAESERVRAALGDIPAATLVSGDGGPCVSLGAIVDALRFDYSILYLVCHGTLRNGQPVLYLENEAGDTELVAGDELAARIADLRPEQRPLLVVLASCQSVGRGSGDDVPSALGPQLASAGVGAVIGMQGDAPMQLVAQLMPRFFSEISEFGEIDRALAVGRAGLRGDSPWWMPVLFLRVREGRLWPESAPAPITPQRTIPAPTATATAQLAVVRSAAVQRMLWAGGALALALVLIIGLFTMMSQWRRDDLTAATEAALIARVTAEAQRFYATQEALTTTASAPPSATDVPAIEPTASPAPPAPTSPPAVQPVSTGKYMLLVADLEDVARINRDYTRDIYEDLQINLEQIPFSDMEIRRYQRVISSAAEAQAAAEQAGAAVVIWGRYSENAVDIQIQTGARSRFPSIPAAISDAVLARTGNLSLSLATTDKLKSIALAALTPINVLKTADSDSFAILRQSAMQDRLMRNVEVAEVRGQSAAIWAYRFITNYYSDPKQALAATSAGLSDNPGNPILLIYRASTNLRLRDLRSAAEDLQASRRLVPGWPMAEATTAVLRYLEGDLLGARDAFDRVIEARPDDWFAYSYRGGLHYLLGNFGGARADLERSIELGSATSQPYGSALIIALREGQVGDAQALSSEVRERFSGTASFDNTFYSSVIGGDNPLSLAISVFDQIVAFQYGDAIEAAERGLAMTDIARLPPLVGSDFLFMRGFAQCNRGEYAQAEQSYSEALALTPDFAVLNLLRAKVRAKQRGLLDAGVAEDIAAAAQGGQPELLAIIQDIQSSGAFDKYSCAAILS